MAQTYYVNTIAELFFIHRIIDEPAHTHTHTHTHAHTRTHTHTHTHAQWEESIHIVCKIINPDTKEQKKVLFLVVKELFFGQRKGVLIREVT